MMCRYGNAKFGTKVLREDVVTCSDEYGTDHRWTIYAPLTRRTLSAS